LEAVVHNSETVLLGKILKVEGEREQLGQMTYKIRFKVEEKIKGGDLLGYFYLFAKREQIDAWIESGARLLLNSPYQTYGNPGSASVFVDLTKPKLQQQLSLGEGGVLNSVETSEELLEILRKTVQRLPGVERIRTFQMPTEPKFVKQAILLIQDGFPIVFVPIDKPLETWAKRVIEGKTELRADRGTRALKNFKSDENIKWVRLAIDNATDDSKRAALNGVLMEWGVPATSR